MNEKTCPLLRDSKNNFCVLERLFGTLGVGMGFGEYTFEVDNKRKFYNAIALTECWCFVISKLDFFNALKDV